MDYKSYMEQYVLVDGFDYSAAEERIMVTYLDGKITLSERDQLLSLADKRANPDSVLPGVEERLAALENRIAGYEQMLILHGWTSAEDCPLVTGKRFLSADQKRHTGDRVSMLLDGEETVRTYICKLNPTWEEKGTAYTPLGNAGSWYEITGKTEETITEYLTSWVNKFPDFNRWVRKETASLVKQDSNSFRGTVNAGVDQ